MKKGCFIIVFTILTILIAAGIYIFKNHKDLPMALLKPIILNSIKDDYDEAIQKYKITSNKAALDSLVSNYIDHARKNSNFRLEQLDTFFSQFRISVRDGMVDSTELTALKNIFEEETQNERPEENRN